jgi:hypothetical protein
LTPAKARKLLKVSEICSVILDPAIEDMARKDTLTFEFNTPPEEKELLQFIVDTNFRTGICSLTYNYTRENLLRMLASVDVRNIIITGQNLNWWSFVTDLKSDMDIQIAKPTQMAEHDFQKGKRNHVVIFDTNGGGSDGNIEIIAKEFPNTLVYLSGLRGISKQRSFILSEPQPLFVKEYKSTPKKHYSMDLAKETDVAWWNFGCALFPNMPRGIFDKSAMYFESQIMHKPVWKKSDVNDMAIMYNVFIPEKMQGYGFHREKLNGYNEKM